jgi:hypothetical protein
LPSANFILFSIPFSLSHHVLHDAYDPPYLTFRHWSGVTPYTLTYVFAGSCVFVKQSPGNLSLRPQRIATQGRPYPEVTAAFLPSSLRTPHSFALVYSTLPPVSVCGTEPFRLTLEVFLESVLPKFAWPKPYIQTLFGLYPPVLPKGHPHSSSTNPIRCFEYNTPSLHRNETVCRNINLLSIASPYRDRLRTD